MHHIQTQCALCSYGHLCTSAVSQWCRSQLIFSLFFFLHADLIKVKKITNQNESLGGRQLITNQTGFPIYPRGKDQFGKSWQFRLVFQTSFNMAGFQVSSNIFFGIKINICISCWELKSRSRLAVV